MSQFPNNSPLADFLCGSCSEEFELKSQKSRFGAKVADGAYKTKCERLAAGNNPNLLLMNYDVKSLSVINLLIVPKHFFVREIIEERKPLAATARRAGMCDDDCPHCGARHMSPFDSENLTELVAQEGKEFVAIRSPRSAEHGPDYQQLRHACPSRGLPGIN
jgi:hypothetical protein